MSSLTVFFSRSVSRFELDSSFLYYKKVIVRIHEVCLELGKFYITPWGWASMKSNEFVILKGVIYLGVRFVREA